MPKNPVPVNITTLRQKADFSRLKESKNKFFAKSALIVIAKTPSQGDASTNLLRLGYIVTKKIGNAVKRNRIRRRLRSSLRAASLIRPVSGFDIIFIAKRHALSIKFADMVGEIVEMLQGLNKDV